VTRPRYPRSSCIVPFCRRTSTLFSGEWVCADHWRLVDRGLKRFRTKRLRAIRRLADKYEALMRAAQARLPEAEEEVWRWADRGALQRRRWRTVERITWARMKRQAIERACGVSL
jgi:hypothetical protein